MRTAADRHARSERLPGKGPLLTSHIKTGLPQWDALNESHSPWRNLWNPDVVCTESVTQLFEAGEGQGGRACQQLRGTVRLGLDAQSVVL